MADFYRDPYASTRRSTLQTGVDLQPRQQTLGTDTYRAPTSATPQASQPAYPTYGPTDYQTPTFPGFNPTSEFSSDPTTANLEALMNYQIPYYMQPIKPYNYLGETQGAYDQYAGTMNELLRQAMGPSPGESGLMSIFNRLQNGGNADAYATEYRNYLNQDPYTGAEWEAYQTEFMDPLQSQRTQAINRALREVSAQGIDPSSGIAQAKLNEVNRAYDAAAAQQQGQLAIEANQQRAQRKGQAFQAGLSAEELKNAAMSIAANAAGNAGSLWTSRLPMAAGFAGQLQSEADARAAMGYNADAAARRETEANYARAMQLAGIMADLPSQRQAEALQLVAMADPAQAAQMYGGMANQYANQAQVANQGSQSVWSGLGSMWPFLTQALSGRPGQTTTAPYPSTYEG